MTIDRDQLLVDAAIRLYVSYRADVKRTSQEEDIARALADAPAIVDAIVAKFAPVPEPEPEPAPPEPEKPSLMGKAFRRKGKK